MTLGKLINFPMLQVFHLENGDYICKLLERWLCVLGELVNAKLSDVVLDAIYILAD